MVVCYRTKEANSPNFFSIIRFFLPHFPHSKRKHDNKCKTNTKVHLFQSSNGVIFKPTTDHFLLIPIPIRYAIYLPLIAVHYSMDLFESLRLLSILQASLDINNWLDPILVEQFNICYQMQGKPKPLFYLFRDTPGFFPF